MNRLVGLIFWALLLFVPPAHANNNSAFVSQSVPTAMTAGQPYSVSVTMMNIGTQTWSAAGSYALGAQNPWDNTTWGFNRVVVPNSVSIPDQVTFTFNVTAPATPGSYNFQWWMVQDGVEWFGELTPNVAVTVTGPPATATYVKTDTGTQGNWKGVYGTEGRVIQGDATNIPGYAAFSVAGAGEYTWAPFPDADMRATQRGAAGRIAACWFSASVAGASFDINIAVPTGTAKQIALYALDWDQANGRAMTLEVRDTNSGALLDTRSVDNFSGGKWLVWNITGAVTIKAINGVDYWGNSVISAVMFDPTGEFSSTNVALQANGGVATASSQADASYGAAATNNGDRKGVNYSVYGVWVTMGARPQWLQIDFNGPKTIGEIDVFSVQDNYLSPSEPTSEMSATNYGITDFEVQYWNGSAWLTVPGGNVTGNTLVWRQFKFNPILTDRIRVYITGGAYMSTLLTEVEAWTAPPGLVTNGGFEAGADPVDVLGAAPADQAPWVFVGSPGGAGVTLGQGWLNRTPPEGRLAGYLQGRGSIRQQGDVATPGNYFVSFRFVDLGIYGCRQSLKVTIDGTPVQLATGLVASEWTHGNTATFALTAGAHTLAFNGMEDNNFCIALIDDVKLLPAVAYNPTTILGSFEEWQIGAGSFFWTPGAQPWNFLQYAGLVSAGSEFGVGPSQGTQAAFLMWNTTMTGSMSQSWTDPGGVYQIQLDAAAYGGVTQQLTVKVDGVTIATLSLTSATYATSTTPSFTLAPGAHSVELVPFQAEGYAGTGTFVDNIQLKAYVAPSAPGGFNAFESATAGGAVTGVIHTKVAASSFALDVVALNEGGSAVDGMFTGDTKVELLDAHDNNGIFTGIGANCRSSWTPIAGTATTLTFAGGDKGRKTVSLTTPDTWRDVRVRISYPATGTPTTVACSTDNFAIRPASFAGFSASDTDSGSAGTMRALTNLAVNGGVVHRAGQPFTVRATAVNATGSTTGNYTGTPTAAVTVCAGGAGACNVGLGSFAATSLTATAGAINSSATYSDVGAYTLQLLDSTFASVDAADGSSDPERTIASPTLDVGRFVPDHYDLSAQQTPVFKTFGSTACANRSFTYIGQAFAYLTAPLATLLARNAAGATTLSYKNAFFKLTSAHITQTFTPLVSATPGLNASAATLPFVFTTSSGGALIGSGGTESFTFNRPNTPLAPFNAAIGLSWSIADDSENAVAGNGVIASAAPLVFSNITFDAGSEFRFGLLHLTPAYGSELLKLPVYLEARYWDGVRWATNSVDQCTALPTSATVMGNYQKNLAACKTAITAATATLVNGRTTLTLARPGGGNNGSVDLRLRLTDASVAGTTCTAVGAADTTTAATAASPNLTWLLGGSDFAQDPSTRASFGQYRAPLIYQRENY